MTLDEIVNGRPQPSASSSARRGQDEEEEQGTGAGDFPGLVGLVYNYLDSLNIDVETRIEMGAYLDLVAARARGELMTTATWIRQYVRSHPEYKKDSVVSPGINYDVGLLFFLHAYKASTDRISLNEQMIKRLDEIERGVVEAPGFLPANYAKRRRAFGDNE